MVRSVLEWKEEYYRRVCTGALILHTSNEGDSFTKFLVICLNECENREEKIREVLGEKHG